MATVIILNGVSSVGKTTLAKAIQKTALADFLHLSMDGFIAMLPDGREFAPDWFPVEHDEAEGGPVVAITSGPLGAKLLATMRKTIADLADKGFDVVVDEVCTAPAITDYRQRLAGHSVHVVKVTAHLDEIERRERERGDRLIGLARGQAGHLHNGIEYDQVVDAGARSAEQCAQAILDALA
ncbi:chloramphenicol phosphotransferase CPT family protein [Alteriqipengyuania sp. 357]